jgi:hypothetical protein
MPDEAMTDVLTETLTDTPPVEAPSTETPDFIGAGPTEGAEPPIEGLEPELGTEPREEALPPWEEVKEMVPKSVWASMRALKDVAPEHLPALREMSRTYGTLQGFKELWSRVEDARVDKSTLESFGGFEGLTKLQNIAERSEQINDMLERGDPKMLDDMIESSKEGFVKLMPEAIKRLERVDPQGHYETLLRPILSVFQKADLRGALETSMREMEAGTPDGFRRAGEWVQKTLAWLGKLEKDAQDLDGRYQDPRIGRFQQEQERFTQTQQKATVDEISRHMDDHMRDTVRPMLTNLAKGRNISQQGLDDLQNAVQTKIREALAKDQFFVSSVKNLVRGRNVENALKFVRPQIDKVRQAAVRDVWTTRYGSAQPRQPQPQPRAAAEPRPTNGTQEPIYSRGPGSSPTNPIPVRSKPDMRELDMAKDPNQINMIAGRGFLKSANKWVTWRPGRMPGR